MNLIFLSSFLLCYWIGSDMFTVPFVAPCLLILCVNIGMH